ncbi:MAG TPA: phenylalanine--tRNA ligase subunit beta [Terriglobales bacterium]|nr:phenylalanine--tRNA ligase subunit beta [Terriglobales bacterium]
MKLSSQWIREFVDIPADDRRFAEDLTSIGIAVEGIAGKGPDTVFEMEIGTNRPDAMNHYGVAREAAALYKFSLKPLQASAAKAAHLSTANGTAEAVPFPSVANQGPSAAKAANKSAKGNATLTRGFAQKHNSADFEITIDDASGCARYTAQIVRGVKIKPSLDKISSRLALVDQRAINNAADASNYTLWEMGHPTHAFDLDLLKGGKIVVRKASAGEMLKTLDGIDRKLSSEDLIIADANKPVALAGVMGGFETMITDRTKNILIESAWFDPVAVRKTARRHALHTDASHRFERGADYGATSLACSLVAQRIMDSGGGKLQGSQIDAIARELAQAPVVLRISQVRRVLGTKLETQEIVALLKRLGFELVPEPGSEPQFSVLIPTWRLDVEREIDIIEEVARLHGYDKFPNTLPAFSGAVVEAPHRIKEGKLRSSLLSLGYSEAVSLTFISHADAEAFSSTPVIELANPLNEEASLMRSSLVPGMLNMLAYNLNRGTENLRLFEIGDVYAASGAATAEQRRICIGATLAVLHHDLPQGEILDKSKDGSDVDAFRALKGDVERLLSSFAHNSIAFDAQTAEYYQPGRSARALIDGEPIAQFGVLQFEVAAVRKLRQEVFIAEILADWLYSRPLREIRYQPLAKFPAVERDWSFLFADEITFGDIDAAVHALRIESLRSFEPIEIFRGGSVPSEKYSILLRAKFQSLERTLREDEVNDWSAQIVGALTKLGGTQRA